MPFTMKEYEKFIMEIENANYNNNNAINLFGTSNNNNGIYLFGTNNNNADSYSYYQPSIFGPLNNNNNTSNINLFGNQNNYNTLNYGASLFGNSKYNNNNAHNKVKTLFGNNVGLFSNNNSLFG